MYNPPHFREQRVEVLHELIRRNRLATLVTLGPEGLVANHIPLILHPDPAPLGTLIGHVSRANTLWRDSRTDVEALAIFQGPDSYISPSWYPSHQETGRVVPTWNYAVVHAHGPLRIFDDVALLERHVRELTSLEEAALPQPWSPDQAPADFLGAMLKGIVGLEIPVARLDGKWKVNQNRLPRDRAGAIRALRVAGDPASASMADLIAERDPET
ncbi:MAG: FMN-binding negative transcriptional regulator [Bryobacteraceae bacterium]|jgi:transcriptional regulator